MLKASSPHLVSCGCPNDYADQRGVIENCLQTMTDVSSEYIQRDCVKDSYLYTTGYDVFSKVCAWQ